MDPMPIDPCHLVQLVDGALVDTDLDKVFAAMADKDRVVVHIHGGLIHGEVAEASAATLLGDYVAKGQVFPVFWVWNSGFLQMQQELKGVLEMPVVRKAIGWLLRLFDKGFAVEHAVAAKSSPWIHKDATFADVSWKHTIQRIAARRGERDLRMIVTEEVLRASAPGRRLIDTWRGMKAVIQRAFEPGAAGAGGLVFLERLRQWWTAGRRVTLVCHSAGAIGALWWLAAADAVLPAGAQFDLVFLAPACTFADFHARRDVLLRRVRSLQMFALRDERERAVYEINKIYPGSILYLVSGLLEPTADTPLVGMQRHHVGDGAEPAVVALRPTFAGASVWTPSSTEPLPSDAETHVQFDDAGRSTMTSVYKLLAGAVAAPPFVLPG